MKNREKYRDEIMEAIKGKQTGSDEICCFLRDNVIPRFTFEADVERDICGNIECYACANIFAFWLDEEYTEPPKPEVDWNKVPVDTLVRVRDSEQDSWKIQYFESYEKQNPNYKYSIWDEGKTSKTADGATNLWKYCELVEEEDGNSNI